MRSFFRRAPLPCALALLALAACSRPDAERPDVEPPSAAGTEAPSTEVPVVARMSAISRDTPESVGMSSEALARIGPEMQRIIDEGRTGGIVTVVARDRTVVHWDAHGWRALGEDELEWNDIFRIYSMTKPVTSVAIMMLVEDGLIGLDQPVAEILPEFASARVYDEGTLRPPRRPPTIRDLLRHTSGLTYGIFARTPVDSMYVARIDPLDMREGGDLEEVVGTIADLPLRDDPGTVWNYSMSVDVLGRVVEVASGSTLADFFRRRIFEPLQMRDTGFHVPAEKLDRLAGVYSPRDGALVAIDPPGGGDFARPPAWYSGGAGLTSTPGDYLRFAQMLLDEGELDGVRLLSAESVRAMRTDQLPPEVPPPAADQGFGLGFAVGVDGPREGHFWWSGVASTFFWIDPVENIIAFAWTQYMPYGGVQIEPLVRGIVYDAVVESNRVGVGG